jgi:hypothetical protein
MLTKSFRIDYECPHEDASTHDDVENFVKSLSAHASPGKVGIRINSDTSDFSWFKWTLFPLCDTYVDGGWDIRVVYEGQHNNNLMYGMYKNKVYDVEVVLMEQSEFESFVEWEREALPNQVDAMRKDLESQAVTCTDEDLTAYSGLLIRSYFTWYDKYDRLISSYLKLYDDRGKKLPKAAPEPKKKMSAQEKQKRANEKAKSKASLMVGGAPKKKKLDDALLEDILAGVDMDIGAQVPKM